ncbi:MAG: sialate O-acetylesterase, partial [Bacteroidales bacterium]|nr:sialate O-acetylesterase [Bacteroidales bacterium]
MKRILLSIALLLSAVMLSEAEVRLPSVLGDNMVLQRDSQVNLWGWAKPRKSVRIKTSWNRKRYRVRADSEGKWIVKVVTTGAGGPYTITFSDGKKTRLENILLGEVWICSGQSNMEMPV